MDVEYEVAERARKHALAMAQQPMPPVFERGHLVALKVTGTVGGTSVLVGEVQAVDADGIRVSAMDWAVGLCCGWDYYLPHSRILDAMVATANHDLTRFGEAAATYQKRVDEESGSGRGRLSLR